MGQAIELFGQEEGWFMFFQSEYAWPYPGSIDTSEDPLWLIQMFDFLFLLQEGGRKMVKVNDGKRATFRAGARS